MPNPRPSPGRETRHGRTRRVARRGGTSSPSFTLAELSAELDRRYRQYEELSARLHEIADELESIEAKIAELSAIQEPGLREQRSPAGKHIRRKQVALPQVLHKVLKGKTLTVKDAVAAARRAGYKTRSPNFRIIVNQALIDHRELFRKVAHGKYTAK